MKTRLDSLRYYLDELDEDRQATGHNFPFEMRNRQIIGEIVKHLGSDATSELLSQLRQTDNRIRQAGKPSGFIWDPRVEHIYPQEQYWYLYLHP